MKTNVSLRSTLLLLTMTNALLLTTGCGSSFKPSGASTPEKETGSNITPPPQTNTPSPTNPSEWQNLTISGRLASMEFGSGIVLSLDKNTKELVLTLPVLAQPVLMGVSLDTPIAKYPGTHLTVEPSTNGIGSNLILRVPIKYLAKGVDLLPASALPNGDPLPKIASGVMPAMALQLPNLRGVNLTVYLDVAAVGVFVNTPFDPYVNLSVPIQSEDGKRIWGYLSSIRAKQKSDGGFFISAQLPDDIARIIDNNL